MNGTRPKIAENEDVGTANGTLLERPNNAPQAPGTRRTAHDRRQAGRFNICWPPRVRRRPLSEILLWSTGSPASWRVSQTPECSGLLTATRGICLIVPQRQPGKFKSEQPNSPRSLAVPARGRGRGRKPLPRGGYRCARPLLSNNGPDIARDVSMAFGPNSRQAAAAHNASHSQRLGRKPLTTVEQWTRHCARCVNGLPPLGLGMVPLRRSMLSP